MRSLRAFEFKRSPLAVVGAACPLGRALVPALLDAGYRVRAVVHDARRIPSFWRAHPNCEVATALGAERKVVWLAHAHHIDPRIEVQANVRMMEAACSSGRRIVFVSSGSAVYGEPGVTPVPEDHPRRPLSSYGMAKCVMEDIVALAATRSGGSVILRAGNIYGREYLTTGGRGVIAAFTRSLVARQPVTLRDGGRGARDYVHVDDVVRAIVASVKWRGGFAVWNAGTGVATTTRDVLRRVCGILGREPEAIIHQQRAAADVGTISLSSSRIEQACGWRPLHALTAGLQITLEASHQRLREPHADLRNRIELTTASSPAH